MILYKIYDMFEFESQLYGLPFSNMYDIKHDACRHIRWQIYEFRSMSFLLISEIIKDKIYHKIEKVLEDKLKLIY